MSKITKAEKWFGKKQKDLTKEELREFWKLESRERRKLPKVKEYKKQYNKKYIQEHREEWSMRNKEWRNNNRVSDLKKKILNSKKDVCDYIINFIDKNSMYTKEYGDVVYSMAIIREIDKLIGKKEPNQKVGE
jgi:hypothetical protein